jgi:hypothetical protein
VNKRKVSLVLLLSLLCSCTTPRLTLINRGEPIAFNVVMSPQAGATGIRNRAIGQDTATGAGAGAVTGALIGLGCGPFIWLCMPLGAMALGGGGGLVGAAVGIAESLSPEKQAQLSDRLANFRQSHDLRDALQAHVVERGRKHWQLSPVATQSVVTIELQDVFVNSTREERIALVMRVMVTVRSADALKLEGPAQKRFDYVGPLGDFVVWMDPHSDFVEISFKSACQHIAAQIISELSAN